MHGDEHAVRNTDDPLSVSSGATQQLAADAATDDRTLGLSFRAVVVPSAAPERAVEESLASW
jgi:hypothetical protein